MESYEKLLEQTREILIDGLSTLDRISETCCMPERSREMAEITAALQRVIVSLESDHKSQKTLSESAEEIAHCGSSVGRLYITCCTETREPLYQQLLKQLNEAHTLLGMRPLD